MVGVAVKVIDVPGQMEVEEAMMDTVGVTEFEVTVIVLLVAIAGEAQAAFDVMVTDTWSLLLRVFVTKLGELVPAFTPFTSH